MWPLDFFKGFDLLMSLVYLTAKVFSDGIFTLHLATSYSISQMIPSSPSGTEKSY